MLKVVGVNMGPILDSNAPYILYAFSGTALGIILACISLAQGLRGSGLDHAYLKYALITITILAISHFMLLVRIYMPEIGTRMYDVVILGLLLIAMSWLFFILLSIIFYFIEWPKEYVQYESLEKRIK